MTTYYLAFYKGKGNWIDWCIRKATRSQYSHVELVAYFEKEGKSLCYSSSARDGGVRRKWINLSSEKWDLVPTTWDKRNGSPELYYIKSKEGAKYDYLGILFSQIFNLNRHNKKRWFCSEICAAALDLPSPQSYSPARLYDMAYLLNHI